jgi:hypothetical protein
VKYKGGHSDIQGEEKMRKGAKKGGALYSMRGPDGRFKAVSKSSEEGQVEKEGIDRLKAVEKGKGREAASDRLIYHRRSVFYHAYCHRDLRYEVYIKTYDFFTHFRG